MSLIYFLNCKSLKTQFHGQNKILYTFGIFFFAFFVLSKTKTSQKVKTFHNVYNSEGLKSHNEYCEFAWVNQSIFVIYGIFSSSPNKKQFIINSLMVVPGWWSCLNTVLEFRRYTIIIHRYLWANTFWS